MRKIWRGVRYSVMNPEAKYAAPTGRNKNMLDKALMRPDMSASWPINAINP